MKRAKSTDFPELRKVFTGYLHEDFREEYDSPAAAIAAFLEDANPSERRRFQIEARTMIDRIAALDLTEIRDLLARLGCRWAPSSRHAVERLLTAALER